jgi:hypothetical protein
MRVCVALFLFLLVGLPIGSPAAADTLPTATELHERMEAALGPEVDNVRSTIAASGTLGSWTTTQYKLGTDSRVVFDNGLSRFETGIYHGQMWRQNENGITQIVASVPVIDPKSELAKANRARAAAAGVVSRTSDPVDAYLLLSGRIRNYIDPATYHLQRVEFDTPDGTFATTSEDYEKIGSRTMARKHTSTYTKGNLVLHSDLTSYEENSVTDADVRIPPDRRTLVEFPSGSTSAELPVQFIKNVIYVRVTIAGRAIDLKLDTGANGILLDPAFVARLNLKAFDPPDPSPLGPKPPQLAVVPEMRIGDLVLRDVAVRLNGGLGTHPEGTEARGELGYDFLARLGVTIDYQAHTVHVTPSTTYVPPSSPTATELKINLASFEPDVPVVVGNVPAENMTIATAFSGHLAFYAAFRQRNPKLFEKPVGHVRSDTPSGQITSPVYVFPKVTIGPMTFTDSDVLAPPASAFSGHDGAIGYDLLSLFDVDLDYAHERVYLTPNAYGKSSTRPVK